MGEITGALIGIALVLSAVFLPMAFFGGSSGVIYRQFSITIVSAMLLSVFVALVADADALCHAAGAGRDGRRASAWRASSAGSIAGFERDHRRLCRICVGSLIVRGRRSWCSSSLPCWSPPSLASSPQLPTSLPAAGGPGRSSWSSSRCRGREQSRTLAVVKQIEDHFLEQKATVDNMFIVLGFSFSGSGQNSGDGLHPAEGLERADGRQELTRRRSWRAR